MHSGVMEVVVLIGNLHARLSSVASIVADDSGPRNKQSCPFSSGLYERDTTPSFVGVAAAARGL